MERLLYISESRIEPANAQMIVQQIVAKSVSNNATTNLTGALLFTGTHFAQILEGTPHSIDQLLVDLCNDPRHQNFHVADRSAIEARKFPDWAMAYSGPSQFVTRHVERLLNDITRSERRRGTEWLTELAFEFSSTRSGDRN